MWYLIIRERGEAWLNERIKIMTDYTHILSDSLFSVEKMIAYRSGEHQTTTHTVDLVCRHGDEGGSWRIKEDEIRSSDVGCSTARIYGFERHYAIADVFDLDHHGDPHQTCDVRALDIEKLRAGLSEGGELSDLMDRIADGAYDDLDGTSPCVSLDEDADQAEDALIKALSDGAYAIDLDFCDAEEKGLITEEMAYAD